jgi:hypothetical protein
MIAVRFFDELVAVACASGDAMPCAEAQRIRDQAKQNAAVMSKATEKFPSFVKTASEILGYGQALRGLGEIALAHDSSGPGDLATGVDTNAAEWGAGKGGSWVAGRAAASVLRGAGSFVAKVFGTPVSVTATVVDSAC